MKIFLGPGKYAQFFWIQPYFVLFEIAVGHMFRNRISTVEKTEFGKMATGCIRLLWALSVLYFTLPTVIDQVVRVRATVALKPIIGKIWV
jgi:hypothetical protein